MRYSTTHAVAQPVRRIGACRGAGATKCKQ